ncbi:MAG: hypothetical protein ACXWC9_10085 [Pseudobdellovibrionaceae bacterium]
MTLKALSSAHLASLFILLSTVFFSSFAAAALSCHQAHSADFFAHWQDESNRLFWKNMLGDSSQGESELAFYWHMGNPMNLKKVGKNRYISTPSGKRMRIYENHPDLESPFPLQAVNTMMGRQSISNMELVLVFLKNFKDRGTPEIRKAIEELEEMISDSANSRQGFGYVATAPAHLGGEFLGTFRVFNGMPSHSNTPATLPFEHLFLKYGVSSKTVKQLRVMRGLDPNALIFEIGKFSLDGPSSLTKRARNMLELFLLRYYVDTLPPEALFVVHCTSLAHVRHYEQRYGLRVVEEIQVPGKGTREYVLQATGQELREAFRKSHQLPHTGVQISNSEELSD